MGSMVWRVISTPLSLKSHGGINDSPEKEEGEV